jgi:DNA processing protein
LPKIESWVRLAKLESPKTAIALADYFGGPDEVFEADTQVLLEVVNTRTADKIKLLSRESMDKELSALAALGARVVSYMDPDYPVNLRQISDPPVALFVRGEMLESDRFAVAVIGTRKPTEYGRSMAMKLSRDLAERGLCVISGGARGIDTVAHTGAIQKGRTIAVLGSGLDVPYPYENHGLFDKITENGAVVSEFVPGTKPDAWRFPVRNRVVSGMSLGVLVVESLVKGGAMITATIAADQGRDVWALPGSTDTAVSHGPHHLIKEGAKLIDEADDILADLGIEVESPHHDRTSIPDNLTPEQRSVIQALNLHPKHVDEIIVECNLTAATASSTLTLLEMLCLIRRVPGNSYVRIV